MEMYGSPDGGKTLVPVKVAPDGSLYAVLDQTTPGTTNGVQMNSISACKLQKGVEVRTSVTCTAANTNYAAGGNIPASTTYVTAYCANHFQIAVGEATSSTVGIDVTAGVATTFPLKAADVSGGNALNVQSDTAGSVVYITYQTD